MANIGNVTVRLDVEDHVTPALNRIHRRMWWMRHGEGVMRAIAVLLTAVAFIAGRVTA